MVMDKEYFWFDPDTGERQSATTASEVGDKLVHHWLGLEDLNRMVGCDVSHWTEEQIFTVLQADEDPDIVKKVQLDREAAALYDDALAYFGYQESRGCAR